MPEIYMEILKIDNHFIVSHTCGHLTSYCTKGGSASPDLKSARKFRSLKTLSKYVRKTYPEFTLN